MQISTVSGHGGLAKHSCWSSSRSCIRTTSQAYQLILSLWTSQKLSLKFRMRSSYISSYISYYGIQGQTLAWVKDFLRMRQQSVVVDGCKSSSSSVLSGVPQGSVLGPMLFLAFLNDLPACVSSSVRLFADDTIMYRPIKSATDIGILQKDLEHLDNWSETWQMDFHPSNCEVMRVQRSKKQLVDPPTYTLQGHGLKWVQCI